MNRKDAIALIRKPVRVWTAANGEYVGELLEVFRTPWRGKVRITGILAEAQHYERGGVCRRGFRVGELIEAGNSSIRPAAELTGETDYLIILDRAIAKCETGMQSAVSSKSSWVYPAFHKALLVARAAEVRRQETGVWSLIP